MWRGSVRSFRIEHERKDDNNVVVRPLIDAIKNGDCVVTSDEPTPMKILELVQDRTGINIELFVAGYKDVDQPYERIEQEAMIGRSVRDGIRELNMERDDGMWIKMHALLFANAPSKMDKGEGDNGLWIKMYALLFANPPSPTE